MEYTCKNCGKTFIPKGHGKKGTAVFCSKKCFGFSSRLPPKKCIQCGKLFKKLKNFGRDKCCSRKCQYLFHRGENHGHWKGGWHINTNGYVRSGVDFKYEHRKVMEEALGRKLLRSEQVHHINGDITDNRIWNLVVVSQREHNAITAGLRRCQALKHKDTLLTFLQNFRTLSRGHTSLKKEDYLKWLPNSQELPRLVAEKWNSQELLKERPKEMIEGEPTPNSPTKRRGYRQRT